MSRLSGKLKPAFPQSAPEVTLVDKPFMNAQPEATRLLSSRAWAALALIALLGAVGLALFLLNLNTPVPAAWGTAGGVRNYFFALLNSVVLGWVLPPMIAGLGALIIARQPQNRIGWLLVALAIGYLLASLLGEITVALNLTAKPPLPGGQLVAWIYSWLWVLIYSLLVLLLALFPNGHVLSRRWALAIGLPWTIFTVCLLIAGMIEQPLTSAYQVPNPFVNGHQEVVHRTLFSIGVPMLPLMLLVVLGQVAVRYRVSGSLVRQQIKWLLVALVATAIITVVGLALVFAVDDSRGGLLVNAAAALPVLAIGFATLRYRLYDIDLVIRRTLAYALVTLVLLLTYFGSVTLLTSLFSSVTGQQSALAIVISTLMIAALFNPLRRHVQGAIDRRFYRQRYDAQQVLAGFANTARDETDLDALTGELVRVLQETMQPERVSVWLVDGAPHQDRR